MELFSGVGKKLGEPPLYKNDADAACLLGGACASRKDSPVRYKGSWGAIPVISLSNVAILAAAFL